MSAYNPTEELEVVELTMLGGLVPKNLHSKFKQAAKDRGEKINEALQNAAMLYLDAVAVTDESQNTSKEEHKE